MADKQPMAAVGVGPPPGGGNSLLADVAPPETRRADTLVDPLLGTTLGNYEILFVLGKGAYGAVYKARDVKLGRFVAIKFLHEFLDARHETMFLREAKAIAALSKHPSIVQIFEWGEYQARNYFVLEFVGSNAAMLLRVNPQGLPLEQALRITAECAGALSYANRQGVIHRDVKPANILLEIEGGRAKLADFGVARFFDPSGSPQTPDAPGGTPGYMAPEVVFGAEGDTRSDIFSLGVTLYELLCGAQPFPGNSPEEIMARVRENDRVPITARKPDFPERLCRLLNRAMAHEAEMRYASADEFERDLRAMLAVLERKALPEEQEGDAVSKEEVRQAKVRAFKAAEDAKQAGAEKLAHALLAQGVESFRDAEAYERVRQYGQAAVLFDQARKQLLAAEQSSKRTMVQIRALKAAQVQMEEAHRAADALLAEELAPEEYAAAVSKDRTARATKSLGDATRSYEQAKHLYEAALVKARQHGEAELTIARKEAEAVGKDAEAAQAPHYAAEKWAAAAKEMAKAAAATGSKEAKQHYLVARDAFEQARQAAEEQKQIAEEKGLRPPIKAAGIDFVWVLPGTFQMGCDTASVEEAPVHEVTFERGFWMAKYPISQTQWQAVMGDNPSGFRGNGLLPVENVSWNDCQKFIQRLNSLGEGEFRLPSEAEWEYACRAGVPGNWCFGEEPGLLPEYAWCPENAGGRTHPVGEKLPNEWGLHDMHGNVCEWCEDVWHQDYSGAPANGAPWLDGPPKERVTRGGSWCIVTPECRSAYRGWHAPPDTRTDFMGLRICRNP